MTFVIVLAGMACPGAGAAVAPVELDCKGPYLRVFPEYMIFMPQYDTFHIKTVPAKSQFMIKGERSDGFDNPLKPKETEWLTIGNQRIVSKAKLNDGSRVTQHLISHVGITSGAIVMTKDAYSTYDKSKGLMQVIGAGQGPISWDYEIDLATLTMTVEWKVALGLFDDKGTYQCTGHSADPVQQRHFDELAAQIAQAKADEQAKADASARAAQEQAEEARNERLAPARQACTNGGPVRVIGSTTLENATASGRVSIAFRDFVFGNQMAQAIPDPRAVASNRCRIEFARGHGVLSGLVSLNDIAVP
jgi:hypothetical protein